MNVPSPTSRWAAPVLLALPGLARAELFTVREPSVTVAGSQALFATGALLLLVLLGFMLVRILKRLRFSFSLRWLFAFCLACGMVIGGGVRWKTALAQLREFNLATEFRHKLDARVSFMYSFVSLEEVREFLSSEGGVPVSIDPSTSSKEDDLFLDVNDMRCENALIWAAESAGISCEVRRAGGDDGGYLIAFVPRKESGAPSSAPASAADAGDIENIKAKLARAVVTLEPGRMPAYTALTAIAGSANVSVVPSPKFSAWRHVMAEKPEINAEQFLRAVLAQTRARYEIRHEAICIFGGEDQFPDEPHVAALKAKLARPVSVNFANARIDEAVKKLSELAGVEISIPMGPLPERAIEARITLRAREVSACNLLKRLTFLAGLEYAFGADSITLSSIGDDDNEIEREEQAAQFKKRLSDCKVSFKFVDKPLADALETVTKSANVSFILAPELKDSDVYPINLRVRDMPAEMALKWILKLSELEYDIRNQFIYISKPMNVNYFRGARRK